MIHTYPESFQPHSRAARALRVADFSITRGKQKNGRK
jgi:hypothetical protein